MTDAFPVEHDAPPEATAVAAPLVDVAPARGRTPAEEARTLMAGHTVGTLATLTAEGDPWASMVAFGQLPDGAPVLLVSTLAEHGRNLRGDPRASLSVADGATAGEDPLDSARLTLAGRVRVPTGAAADAARDAFHAAAPTSRLYAGFGDFSLYVLDVERVRWVGGYGRMDSAGTEDYRAAEPDPVAPSAGYATRHLNEDHADALLDIARVLGGFTDATAATCKRCDRYGIDLWVQTPRGGGPSRVAFAEPCTEPGGLRAATVELTHRARGQ